MEDLIDSKFFTYDKLYIQKMIEQKMKDDQGIQNCISKIGETFVISDTLLGKGSFGDVYIATDENGNKVAVKCCDIDKCQGGDNKNKTKGIPNILEASIMASIIHPGLNNALRIHASETKLYIIQHLALTDLAQYTRKNKGNHKPRIEELRQWCFSVANGLAALHNERIIHADIKASNILLYADGTVKLSDYTLATKKWEATSKFTHNACTCTHRPLEGLTGRCWDESLDIWSLGCTFYEIAYGELLFPYQGELEPNQKIRNKAAKYRTRQRSINVLIDWALRGPNAGKPGMEVDEINPIDIDYIPFILSEDYHVPEKMLFNDLICSMLVINPTIRPSIRKVLDHPFFKGLKSPLYLSVKRPIKKIPVSEQARVTRYIQRYSSNTHIQILAFNIYSRCNGMTHITEALKAAASTWLASKLVIGYPTDLPFPLGQLLAAERDICHNLLFRLHSI